MKVPKIISVKFVLLLLFAWCGEAKADPASAKAFAAMLTNATLNGTWAPVAKGAVGDDQKDGYHIVRAEPKGGNEWHIVSRVTHKGRVIDYPIPVQVHFAGDTAVMTLNKVPVGDGGTWSARVLFHDDVYAGSWWSPDKTKSGIVSGTITRGE